MFEKILSKRKLIISALLFFIVLSFSVKPALAYQSVDYPNYLFEFNSAIKEDSMNLQSFINETMKAIPAAIIHMIIGTLNPFDNPEELYSRAEPQEIGLAQSTGLLIAALYAHPPASGVEYMAHLGKKLGIVKTTYAEATYNISGFTALQATQKIWMSFRNISYGFFAIILVLMGFAIMFRVKISPQAVITIQSALPKIVIALLLITFSYAIVGFMINIAYWIIGIIAGIFDGLFEDIQGWSHFWANLQNNWAGSISHFFIPNAFDAEGTLTRPLVNTLMTVNGAIIVFILFSWAIFTVLTPLIMLIVSIVLVIALFRCLWTLLKAFTMIVINLIFAPFRILVGVLPGSSAITDWFKDLLANIAVLPTMITIFYIASYFIFVGASGLTIESIWKDFFLSGIFFWREDSSQLVNALFPFIGLGMLLLAPKVSDIIQAFITKKPFQFETAIGEYGSIGARMTQKGWETFKEKSGMTIEQEGKRKAKVDAAAEKYKPQQGTP
jgi:hypothetical protein